jgi:signal transduction histidine kinase
MASALAESATLRAVAAAVVQHGRNVLGAAAGEVLLLSGSSLVTLYADAPAVPAQISLQAGLCTTDVVANREPVFVSSFDEWQERFSRSATQAADGGYVSSATLPLLVDGAVMGTVAFHFTAPVNFDDEYRALLLSVAQQCAQALDRARVYEAAQQARAEAEAANRMKDEFVSIVSHELRTPLNAIIGWTSLLQQQGALDDDGRERAVQSVADNAARQLRLVQDLLDFSRLQAGRMSLDVEDIDLRTLIRGVVETILPTAAGSRLQIDVQPIPAIKVRGDATRLEQVFLNLLGNAVKFTPAGGQVRVGVRAGEGSVEITVGDTGEGIDPAFLPHMFEAFRQAETSRSSRHGGVGLGLSIAKQLVEAHNGNIRAESGGPGCGATFIVSLPVAATIAASTSGVVH